MLPNLTVTNQISDVYHSYGPEPHRFMVLVALTRCEATFGEVAEQQHGITCPDFIVI